MEDMTEISGTGFFFARMPDGGFSFARMVGEEKEELDPPMFAEQFGATVESEEARKQAAGILNEVNKSMRLSLSLAPFAAPGGDGPEQMGQEMNAGMGSFLGG